MTILLSLFLFLFTIELIIYFIAHYYTLYKLDKTEKQCEQEDCINYYKEKMLSPLTLLKLMKEQL